MATAFAIVTVFYIAYSAYRNFVAPPGVDFVSFWAAAHLAVHGSPHLAYDIGAHRTVELSAGALQGQLPFPYPPPFLAVIAPLGLIPFWPALVLWLVSTISLYIIAARKIAPLPYSLAVPAAQPNALIGQNGFLLTAIFLSGTAELTRRPFRGGLILGLFVFKPQLALLLPVALLAGREWTAMWGAVLTALVLTTMALVLLGPAAYSGFLEILPHYAGLLRDSRFPWNELASPFAMLRFLGVPQTFALALHSAVAAFALGITWRAWSRGWEERVPILAAASILVPPYLFTYDTLLMVVPLGWLLQRRARIATAVIWLLCLLPVLNYSVLTGGPNTIPLAALACILLCWKAAARRPIVNAPPSSVSSIGDLHKHASKR